MATRNVVPRETGQGTIGTLIKRWLGGFFKWLDVSEYIDFNEVANPSWKEGRVFYDDEEHVLSVYNENSEVTHNLGQEHLIRVHNSTGSTIPNGKIVRIQGVESGNDHPLIVLAQANLEANAHALGMTTTTILDGEHGYVTIIGIVHNLDTSNFSSGNILYLSSTTPGELTTTKPSIVTLIGVVLVADASEGTICVALEEYGAVDADMLKSVYDPDVDGIVDRASSVCIFARKGSSGAIAKGRPIYLTGYNVGGWVEVEEAEATDNAKMPAIGLTTEILTASETKKLAIFGRLANIDTSSYSLGDSLFVSTTPGELTNIKPQGNNYIQKVGQVIKVDASTGIIEIFGAGRTNDIPNIFPYTEKVTPHNDDTLFLEDSEDSYNKKKLKISSLGTHAHSNKTEIDLVTDGDHDVRTDNPHQLSFNSLADIQYDTDEGITSTTSLTYINKLSFNFVPADAGTYIVSWYFEDTNSNVNKGVQTRIELDDTTELGAHTTYPEIAEEYNQHSGFAIVDLGSGSHQIDLDLRLVSTGIARVRRTRMYIRKIS